MNQLWIFEAIGRERRIFPKKILITLKCRINPVKWNEYHMNEDCRLFNLSCASDID